MKIKTKDAIGIQLDWLVAKCGKRSYYHYTPSTNWKQGGPIIEREGI